MGAVERQPIDLETHRGSRWTMHIRDGLVDPKHCKAMGEALWLYIYLHRGCNNKTGEVKHYRHDDAVKALGKSLRTIKIYMRRLEVGGYIVTQRKLHHLAVTITRYEWQDRYAADPSQVSEPALDTDAQVLEVASDPPSQVSEPALDSPAPTPVECNILPSQVQHPSRGTIFTSSFTKDVNYAADPKVLCDTLGITDTPASIAAMTRLVAKYEPEVQQHCKQSLEEMALEARAYHDDPKRTKRNGRKTPPSVASFGTWCRNAIAWAPAAGGKSLAAPRSEARAHEVAPNYQRPPVAEPPPTPVCTVTPRELLKKAMAEAMTDPEYRADMEARARDRAKFNAGPPIPPLSARPVASGAPVWPA